MSGKLEMLYRQAIDVAGQPERLYGVTMHIRDVTHVAALEGHTFELGFGMHAYQEMLEHEIGDTVIEKICSFAADAATVLSASPATHVLVRWSDEASMVLSWSADRSAAFAFVSEDLGGLNQALRDMLQR